MYKWSKNKCTHFYSAPPSVTSARACQGRRASQFGNRFRRVYYDQIIIITIVAQLISVDSYWKERVHILCELILYERVQFSRN